MLHYLIEMPYNPDFTTKRTERFDYGQQGIKRNKELDDFIDKLCERISLEEHTMTPSCVHPTPSLFYSPDKVLKEVGDIKNERDQLREEINNLRIEFDERITKLEKEKDDTIKKLIQKSDKEIYALKEILGKNSDWTEMEGYYKKWIDNDEQTWTPPVKDFDLEKVIPIEVTKTTVFYQYKDKIDFDKVKTLEDCIAILKTLNISFEPSIDVTEIEHLVTLEEKSIMR